MTIQFEPDSTPALRAELDQRLAEARTLARAGGVYLVQSFPDGTSSCIWCDCTGPMLHQHSPEEQCREPVVRSMHMFTPDRGLLFGSCARHWAKMVNDMWNAIKDNPMPTGMSVLDVAPGEPIDTIRRYAALLGTQAVAESVARNLAQRGQDRLSRPNG